MDINTLLKGIDCACGKHHSCDISAVYIGKNATEKLGTLCADYNNILIVADGNTYKVGGIKTENTIKEKISNRIIFPGETLLIPNEEAIEKVTETLKGIDLIVGIGSGVIQDLCKYVSSRSKIPYYIVATAPSMDGYASSGAAMITSGMKVTYSAKVPDAIIADTEILKDAPLEMIKAGYGDIIGKYSALNDWKLSHIVHSEFFCQYIYDLMFDALKKTLPLSKKLLERDEESIGTLMEALVIAGIAMSFLGNSRPASGSEHHLSHFFEITGIINNEYYFPHGVDVLYSTYITSKIREKLLCTNFPIEQFKMENELYKAEIERVYKSVADECIILQDKMGRYKENRTAIYKANEKEIKDILKEVPASSEIANIICDIELNLDSFYAEYGINKLADAVKYAKDLKDRYTVLWMYYDIFGTEAL